MTWGNASLVGLDELNDQLQLAGGVPGGRESGGAQVQASDQSFLESCSYKEGMVIRYVPLNLRSDDANVRHDGWDLATALKVPTDASILKEQIDTCFDSVMLATFVAKFRTWSHDIKEPDAQLELEIGWELAMDLECVEMETFDAVYSCKPEELTPPDPRMAVNKARMIDFDEWLSVKKTTSSECLARIHPLKPRERRFQKTVRSAVF